MSDLIYNYPSGYIGAENLKQTSSQQETLQDKINDQKEELKRTGYVERADGSFEKVEGGKTIRVTVSNSGEVIRETITQTASTQAQTSEYSNLQREIRKTERALESASGASEVAIQNRLNQLYEMRDNLEQTGSAFYTVKGTSTVESSQTSNVVSPVTSTIQAGQPLYVEITEQGLGSQILTAPSSQATTGLVLTQEAKTAFFEPQVTTKTESFNTVQPTSKVFGSTPLYTIQKTIESLTGKPTEGSASVQSQQVYQGIQTVGEVGLGIGQEVTGIIVDIGETASTSVASVPSYLGIDVKRVSGYTEEGKPIYESSTRKLTGEEALTVGVMAGGAIPKVGQVIIGGVSVYSGIRGISTISSAESPTEVGSGVAQVGLGILGKSAIQESLNIREFTSKDILTGTIKESPSTVSTSVRSQEFLKSRGITQSTFDTAESIPYITLTKYTYEPVEIISRGISVTEFVPISSTRTYFDVKVITDVSKPSGISAYTKESYFPKTSGDRTQYILAPETATARITEFGLIPESTGRIPLREVSKYPYERAPLGAEPDFIPTSLLTSKPSFAEIQPLSNVLGEGRIQSQAKSRFIPEGAKVEEVVFSPTGEVKVFYSKPSYQTKLTSNFDTKDLVVYEPKVNIQYTGKTKPYTSSSSLDIKYTTQSTEELYSRGIFREEVRSTLGYRGVELKQVKELKPVLSESSGRILGGETLLIPSEGVLLSDVSQASLLDFKTINTASSFNAQPSVRFKTVPYLSLSQEPKRETIIKSTLETKPKTTSVLATNLITEPSRDMLPKEEVKSKIVQENIPIQKQKQNLEQKQVLRQKQQLEVKEELKLRDMLRPRPSKPTETKPIEKPSMIMPIISKSKEFKPSATLEVRKAGKWSPIEKGDVEQISQRGQDIVKGTLRASYRVKGERGEVLDLPTPLGFTRSKREKGVIVQPREKRLSSRSEVQEIQFSKNKLNFKFGG